MKRYFVLFLWMLTTVSMEQGSLLTEKQLMCYVNAQIYEGKLSNDEFFKLVIEKNKKNLAIRTQHLMARDKCLSVSCDKFPNIFKRSIELWWEEHRRLFSQNQAIFISRDCFVVDQKDEPIFKMDVD